MTEGYPKAKYHMRGRGSVLVTSPEQEKALGSEWIDNKPIHHHDVAVTEKLIESPRSNQQLNASDRRPSKR